MATSILIKSLKINDTHDTAIKNVNATVAIFEDTSDVFDEVTVSLKWNTNTGNTVLFSNIVGEATVKVENITNQSFDSLVNEVMQ